MESIIFLQTTFLCDWLLLNSLVSNLGKCHLIGFRDKNYEPSQQESTGKHS